MEKYTVDIDKVLDDFEESEEALQVNHQNMVLENVNREQWTSLSTDVCSAPVLTEKKHGTLVQKLQGGNSLINVQENSVLLNPPVALNENDVYMLQIGETPNPGRGLFGEKNDLIAELDQPSEYRQSSSSCSSEIYCKSFQPSSVKRLEVGNKPNAADRTSNSKTVDNGHAQCPQEVEDIAINNYVGGNESLCSSAPAEDSQIIANISTYTSLVTENCSPLLLLNPVKCVQESITEPEQPGENNVLAASCTSVCRFSELNPHLEISEYQSRDKLRGEPGFSEAGNPCVFESDNESCVSDLGKGSFSESSSELAKKSVSNEICYNSHVGNWSMESDEPSKKSKYESVLQDLAVENEEENVLNSQEGKSEEINDDLGVSCSPLKTESAVGFFTNDDPSSVSVDEMNDYLVDVSEADVAQDEDSGVSSQEGDVNGNNLVFDILNDVNHAKTGKTQLNSCSDCRNLETGDSFQIGSCSTSNTAEYSNEQQISEHTEINGNSEVVKSDNGKNTDVIHTEIIRDCQTTQGNASATSCLKSDIVTECANVLSGARPKEKEVACGVLACSDKDTSSEGELKSDSKSSSSHDSSTQDKNNVVMTSDDHLEGQHDDLLNPSCNYMMCVPSEGQDQNLSDSGNVENISGQGINDGSILIPSETTNTSQLPMRLQRPTTLDLPSHILVKAISSIDSATEDMSVSPNCGSVTQEIIDESNILTESVVSNKHLTADDSKNVTHSRQQLGFSKPFWIPDGDASSCMHCNMRFRVFRRRHHCRACGKVLCSRCCNQKAQLPYLQNKEDRVCQQCCVALSNVSPTEQSVNVLGESPCSSSCSSSPNFSPSNVNLNSSNCHDKNIWRPHPNNPEEYCSTIPPLQQVKSSANCPPPTVMVPVGVLKRGNKPKGEPKQVIFSDGIRPGGDLTDLTEPLEIVPPYRPKGRKRVDKVTSPSSEDSHVTVSSTLSLSRRKVQHPRNRHKRIIVSDSEGPLAPILWPSDSVTDLKPDIDSLLSRLQDNKAAPVVFAATKNMHILTKITKLDCCFGKECWCFTSRGLCTVGQDEVMVILERMPDENLVPRDIFRLFSAIYDNASKGATVDELGHIIFPDGIFGSWEHRGFLFIRPTFQCLSNLVVPSTPFLVAILIQKWEVPWAKVFPLRLMLRLGAECRYYPCALVSIRFRKPVYFEIGQTIMTVLADLRNYQFTIPLIPGVVIHMEEKKTSLNIPRNRYDKIMKVINSNNVEHVLALASNFSTEADSHLVCMQKDEGDYQTQAINIENTPRRVTGASFIVFSGALKSSSGLSAKFSIVEDGLLVQISQETMAALHSALQDMRDLTIPCGPINAAEPEEVVLLQWTRDDRKFNLGVRSPIDGRSLEGVRSMKIHTSTDYAGEHHLIRWTEAFFLETDENGNSKRNEGIDPSRLSEVVAQACCMSLTPHLDQLVEADITKLGLRVTLDVERDKVEYEVGSNGSPLPSIYMNALDNGIIPVISRVSGSSLDGPISLELIFHILIK